jgi:hypothetical protein
MKLYERDLRKLLDAQRGAATAAAGAAGAEEAAGAVGAAEEVAGLPLAAALGFGLQIISAVAELHTAVRKTAAGFLLSFSCLSRACLGNSSFFIYDNSI